MKEANSWQEAMIIRFKSQLDEETGTKAKQVMLRHGVQNMTLEKLSEWAERFRNDEAV